MRLVPSHDLDPPRPRPWPFLAACLALLSLAVAVGCTDSGESGQYAAGQGNPGLRVVATTSMVADLAARVAGPHAQVTGLMGAGVDPHLYKATPRDFEQLNAAGLILYNGLHLEGKMAEALETFARRRPVRAVGASLAADRLLASPLAPDQHDPHIWFDVELWIEACRAVEQALLEVDPAHAADYRAAGQAYRAELAELHAWCKTRAAELPPERRILITSHDAYNYFGRAYGFQVVGIQGISTVTEAGLADIQKTVQFIQERGVKAIFVESSVSPDAIRRVAQDAGVRVGGELYSDAMGPDGSPEGTYPGMVRHNLNTIVEALR